MGRISDPLGCVRCTGTCDGQSARRRGWMPERRYGHRQTRHGLIPAHPRSPWRRKGSPPWMPSGHGRSDETRTRRHSPDPPPTSGIRRNAVNLRPCGPSGRSGHRAPAKLGEHKRRIPIRGARTLLPGRRGWRTPDGTVPRILLERDPCSCHEVAPPTRNGSILRARQQQKRRSNFSFVERVRYDVARWFCCGKGVASPTADGFVPVEARAGPIRLVPLYSNRAGTRALRRGTGAGRSNLEAGGSKERPRGVRGPMHVCVARNLSRPSIEESSESCTLSYHAAGPCASARSWDIGQLVRGMGGSLRGQPWRSLADGRTPSMSASESIRS